MSIAGKIFTKGNTELPTGFDLVVVLSEANENGLVDAAPASQSAQENTQQIAGYHIAVQIRVEAAVEGLGEAVGNSGAVGVAEIVKSRIQADVQKYYDAVHKPALSRKFRAGVDRVNYAGRVFGSEELMNLVDSSLEFYLTAGRYDKQFSEKFSEIFSEKDARRLKVLTVNSGSSANLIAISTLTSPKLKEQRLVPGDEVVTVAAGFPTTIAPIVQNGLVPVFVDVDLNSLNIDYTQIEEAIGPRTKAIMIAHTLGIPFDLDKILGIAEKHKLWVIEDNCDALGATFTLDREYTLLRGKVSRSTMYTGTIGHIGTSSFYPAHQITMGEGGAVYMTDPILGRAAESFRDWGRDCYCPGGQDNTCKRRFDWQLGLLPKGYDHKYTYSHIGYNLKITDMQASIGVAQLDRVLDFAKARFENWKSLRSGLENLQDTFTLPSYPRNAQPSPFGFALTLKEDCGFSREDITQYLENHHIQTRTVFAGNILRQPAFTDKDVVLRIRKSGYLNSSNITEQDLKSLTNTDIIMERTFWIGVYPGLKPEMIDYMVSKIQEFVSLH